MAGIYIHIPFCKQACHYCDFHFSTQHDYIPALCSALVKELEMQKGYLAGEPIQTIYFGGGTPSLVSEEQLTEILNAIHKDFSVSKGAEVTLEANPDDITKDFINALLKIGVNRLSIGVQSFDNTVLRFLNRSHNGLQAIKAIDDCRDGGIKNLNVDLIYAIPGRDLLGLQADLSKLIDIKPDHISAYSLTVEPNTAFGKWSNNGKFVASSEEDNAQQFDCVMTTLMQARYQHYEISNYCLPGREAVHNTNYWRQKKYLGVGPSAHSFNGTERWSNIRNNHTYIKSIHSNTIPATIETLTLSNQINEYIMTSLRTQWGCSLQFLLKEYNLDLTVKQAEYLEYGQSIGLFILTNDHLTLMNKGKFFADSVATEFFEV
jgi:oxygen-independent coproporphyrinogen III oxidase